MQASKHVPPSRFGSASPSGERLRSIYLRAGLFAEGPSDHELLEPLINRLLDSLGSRLYPGAVEVEETLGIDAPSPRPEKRADRIHAAVEEHFGAFTLLVIHADGAGAPDEVRKTLVAPGVELVKGAFPVLVSVPCIPVRELEAWMLADGQVFSTLLGRKAVPAPPADPEREADPKQTLRRILRAGGMRRGRERVYRFFGEDVRIEALRALGAFQQFEADLGEAIQVLARALEGAEWRGAPARRAARGGPCWIKACCLRWIGLARSGPGAVTSRVASDGELDPYGCS